MYLYKKGLNHITMKTKIRLKHPISSSKGQLKQGVEGYIDGYSRGEAIVVIEALLISIPIDSLEVISA